jgi:hypothetical protein
MTPQDVIRTAIMLGAFVFLAGLYGLLYSIAMLRNDEMLLRAGWASYAMQCVVTLAIVITTPLLWPWKLLIVASAIVYLRIPPVTWRYLQRIDETAEQHR